MPVNFNNINLYVGKISKNVFSKCYSSAEQLMALEYIFQNRMLLKTGDKLKHVYALEFFAKNQFKIKANYGKDIDLATLFTEALIDLHKKGYKLPKEIIYGHGGEFEIARHQMNPRTMLTNWRSKIYINPNYDFSYVEEEMAMSNKSPKHCIYHEVGEILLVSKMSTFFKSLSWPSDLSLPLDQQIKIAKEVSNYGSTDIKEFVAEVFAGHMSGKKYSKDIMDLYNKYNGPTLK